MYITWGANKRTSNPLLRFIHICNNVHDLKAGWLCKWLLRRLL